MKHLESCSLRRGCEDVLQCVVLTTSRWHFWPVWGTHVMQHAWCSAQPGIRPQLPSTCIYQQRGWRSFRSHGQSAKTCQRLCHRQVQTRPKTTSQVSSRAQQQQLTGQLSGTGLGGAFPSKTCRAWCLSWHASVHNVDTLPFRIHELGEHKQTSQVSLEDVGSPHDGRPGTCQDTARYLPYIPTDDIFSNLCLTNL